MKNIQILICLILCSIDTSASTNITTANVSGHWTLAGSPYVIYNNITVQSTASLVIDPGVQVIFNGSYFVEVYGILRAAGTSSQHISFTVSDTTGWTTDTATGTGG